MHILFLTKYTSAAASTRYRISQYLSYFELYGCRCTSRFLLPDAYIERFNHSKRFGLFRMIWCYLCRIVIVLSLFPLANSRRYDLIFIQYELLPFAPPWLEWILHRWNIPFILDYDDAVFHRYDQHSNRMIRWLLGDKMQVIGRMASHIITGSPYLTAYFSTFQPAITEIPTSVDRRAYSQHWTPTIRSLSNSVATTPNRKPFMIGWIGSRSTSRHLLSIVDVLIRFSRRYNTLVRLIGFDKTLAPWLPARYFQLVDWELACDQALLDPISVGIMPLINGHFERGKCGFKLIQYMACSKPFIASPVDANLRIDRNGENLFANSPKDWFQALEVIYKQPQVFDQVGHRNRQVVEKYYSIQANHRKYLQVFGQLIGNPINSRPMGSTATDRSHVWNIRNH